MTLRVIAGKFKGRLLKVDPSTRPTKGMLRAAVFNICQHEILNARFLDLFAGSGAMGLEALSRGASYVTFIEHNRHAAACIRKNIASFHVENQSRLLSTHALQAIALLTQQSMRFDIVYIDPPYDLFFPLDPLISLLAPHALLFLEERHNPKKKYPFPESADLQFKETRRFGIALLSIFHYKHKP